MQQPKRNYTGLIAILVSISVSLGIGMTLYYFKTQQNELVQNQLHFSELGLLSNDILNAFSQIQTLTDLNHKILLENCPIELDTYTSEEQQANRKVCEEQIDAQTKGLALISQESPTLRHIQTERYCQQGNEKIDSDSVSYSLIKAEGTQNRSDNRYQFLSSFRCLSFKVPLHDFISTKLNHLSLVALVGRRGQVLSTFRNQEDTYQHSLSFNNIAALLQPLLEADKEDLSSSAQDTETVSPVATTKGYSTFIEHPIGGVRYRVYFTPVNVPPKLEDEEIVDGKLYLVGIRPYQEISVAKLYVPPQVATAIIVGLMLVIVALPLIKLRFVSHKYCFKKSDAQLISLGLLLLVGFSAIYGVSLIIQREMTMRVDNNAAIGFQHIKNNFKTEVIAVTKQARDYAKCINYKDISAATNRIFTKPCPQATSPIVPNLESLFKANEKGDISNLIYRTHEKFARNTRPNIAHREYFKAINEQKAWHLPNMGQTQRKDEQFFIQRIFNIADSRKSSQFGWSLPNEFDNGNNQVKVLSGSVNLQSLKTPLLPRNMKFVVFDTPSGEVLYSSNDTDSLVENFYIASDNSPLLRQFLVSNRNGHTTISEYRDVSRGGSYPFKVSGSYHGREVDYYVGKLMNELPWTLVIIHEKQELQYISMIAILFAMVLLTLLMLVAFVVIRVTFNWMPWQSMLLYRKTKTYVYFPFSLLVVLMIIVQLVIIFYVQDLILHIFLGLLSLLIILRMASLYLFPNRRLKRVTGLGIVLSTLVIIPYAVWRLTDSAYLVGVSEAEWISLCLMLLSTGGGFCWFHHKYKKSLARARRRDIKQNIRGYAFHILALLLAISFVPAVLFITTNYNYLYQQLARLEQFELNHRSQQRLQNLNEYFNYIGHPGFANKCEFVVNAFKDFNSNETDKTCLHPNLDTSDRWPVFWEGGQENMRKGSAYLEWEIFDFAVAAIDYTLQLKVLNYLREQGGATPLAGITIPTHTLLKHSLNSAGISLFLFIFSFLAVFYYICREMIGRRFLGVDLSDDFRSRQYHYEQQSDIQRLIKKLSEPRSGVQHALILRPTRKHIASLLNSVAPRLFKQKVLDLHALLMNDSLCLSSENGDDTKALQGGASSEPHSIVRLKTGLQNNVHQHDVLVLKNLGAIAFNAEFRKRALQFIEFAMAQPSLSIIILADVSPLYKLTQQYAYPNIVDGQIASQGERILWSNIFSRFSKYYDWNPTQEQTIKLSPNILTILENETSCWPEMGRIAFEFYEYHYTQRLSSEEQQRVNQQVEESKKKEKTLAFYQVTAFKESVEHYWSAQQLYNFLCEHAGAIFRYRWEQCTKHERMLLYNLATDHLANPLGYGPLSHLIRRGYIIKRAIWRIGSESFKNFILTAESNEIFKRWLLESEESIWRYARIPIFTFIIVLAGVMIYSATEAIEPVLGLLTALLTLLPLILKNSTRFKNASSETPGK
ncbi:hypothetical protein [Alteromonas sp. ASW11-130]|uniref:hypothetical protein n=1 Tax=Alteromonas sp. ASW11-130 TaxID=3015775 RepID=UPI0022419892|nr:hypothetical protein [Alteromonas sp. ASW11-130]MCW8092775.1 hypothetical protein [Alteromonas sp. ASW11-130]